MSDAVDVAGRHSPTSTVLDASSLVMVTLASAIGGALSTLMSGVNALLFGVFCVERVYASGALHRPVWLAMLDALEKHALLVQRREMQGARLRPSGVVVGPWLRWAVVIRGDCATDGLPDSGGGGKACTLHVYAWRWAARHLPHELDLARDAAVGAEGIQVMREFSSSGSYTAYHTRQETSVPGDLSEDVLRRVNATAARIVTEHGRARSCSRILLTGPPGYGKTTAARAVARELGATLVPVFDPTRAGQSLGVIVCKAHDDVQGAPLIIVIEEVEECLRRIGKITDPAPTGASTRARDSKIAVVDKASWNGMMDYLRFIPNTCLLMTSNLSEAELRALDAPHGHSLLRDGRVTAVIDLHNECDAPETEPALHDTKKLL